MTDPETGRECAPEAVVTANGIRLDGKARSAPGAPLGRAAAARRLRGTSQPPPHTAQGPRVPAVTSPTHRVVVQRTTSLKDVRRCCIVNTEKDTLRDGGAGASPGWSRLAREGSPEG